MQYTLSNEDIEKSVKDVSVFLAANSIKKKEAKRWCLLMEQLLLLYRDQDKGTDFWLECIREKDRVNVLLSVNGEEHNYLVSDEDIIVSRLIADSDNVPKWCFKNNCNKISYTVNLQFHGIWSLKFLLPYLNKTKKNCLLAFLFQGLVIATSIIIPVITAKIIVAYTDSEIKQIIFMAVVLALTEIVCYLCDCISVFFYVKLYNNLRNELEIDLSRKILHLEEACINEYGTGMFIQRLTNDATSVAGGFGCLAEPVSNLIRYFGIIIATGFISLPICLFFVIAASVSGLIEYKRIRQKGQDDRKYRYTRDNFLGLISEMIHGVKELKTNNCEDLFLENLDLKINASNLANYRLEKYNAIYTFFRNASKSFFNFLLYVWMVHLISKGDLTAASALVVFNYSLAVTSLEFVLGNFFNSVNSITVSSERIFQVLYSPDFKEEKFGERYPDKFRGNISFQNVSFSYNQEKLGAKQNNILHDFNMEIRAGEKVAIVGRSGSGKTTIFNLITRLYQIDSGKILIDGENIDALAADFLRRNISAVGQNPYIFNMTVSENLNLAGENISREEMENACKAACVYDDIKSMPKGFDTMLGENGVLLSGGQRQRLAIARCLLRKSRMVLLDEATSALDNETQNNVVAEIGKYFSDSTVITIAHRLSTIVNSDRILFLSDGKIIAEGKHNELLEKCQEYRNLYGVK